MVSKVRSLGIFGIGGYEVSVEIFLSGGLPQFDVVGLPDAAVKEARDRVRAAIKNNGLNFPVSRVTVNLAPADTRKAGTVYDLPILLGILAAAGEIKALPQNSAFIGELSLTGELRPVRGALPMALFAARAGIQELFVPSANASEAAFAEGLRVWPVPDLRSLLSHLSGSQPLSPAEPPVLTPDESGCPDFAEVKGQEKVKRALEVAAAGGHNILMVGPPGSGKSMLARRLPSILPDMSREEVLESTEIHSVMGLTDRENPILRSRPFRSPHHTVSTIALSGGGANLRPGEISLAHNGVLFLDEVPEFSREALEVLRQPLEDGVITISRASGSVSYPSRFMLVCAMNPCKCGWYGHPERSCRCTEKAVRDYHARLSGPLLDRIDLIVDVPSLEYDELRRRPEAESSKEIKKRVNLARAAQRARFGGKLDCNAQMGPAELEAHCRLSAECDTLMRRAFEMLSLTARSYGRILRVARTIADLAGEADISPSHLAEAVQYRSYDFLQGT